MSMTTNEIGLREARKEIGNLANRADLTGEITYLTRNGRDVAAVVPIKVAQEAYMRIVSSTVAREDVDEIVAEEIREAVEAGDVIRETYRLDEIGQKEYWVRLVEYKLAGIAHWAVAHDDPAEAELMTWDERDHAERSYETRVRELSEISGWTWDETDVEL
jgi:antitoxin (DNA-binding transcriptional repressor) of toxin-antitoxin stability system